MSWISVHYDMPIDHVKVFVLHDSGRVSIAYHWNNNWHGQDQYGSGWLAGVIGWMPIPNKIDFENYNNDQEN